MKYDVFISYRREGGKEYARLLKPELEKRGFTVFLDFDELNDGVFDQRIKDAISASPVFLLILSRGALDRCVNDGDWVREEILHAESCHCHIIPVEFDKSFREMPATIPDPISAIIGAHSWAQIDTETLLQESVDKLVQKRIRPYIPHEEGQHSSASRPTQGNEVHIDVDADCDLFRFKTSPFEITRRDTGQKIFFRGLDDPGKSKGITARRGYIQGAWFEEADQFSSMKEIDTVLQTLGRGGEHFQAIYTYNPPESNAHWINVEMAQPNLHRFKLHTTYRDVPESWLGPFFFHRMEAIRAQSETRYQHEYEGIPTGTGHEIFTNIRLVHFTQEEIAEMRRKRWGMDFGQGHPTVIVGTNYIPKLVDGKDIGGRLQIFDAWGKSNARNREVYEELERRDLLNTRINGDPGGGGKGVIGELRDMGARRIVQAYKPGGSVERGVNWMRDLEAIEIHDELEWCIRQFKLYLWLTMKDGTNRNELPDINDDFIDAARYSREDEIFANGRSRLAIDF